MQHNQELPCGGYIQEDKIIKDNMKKISEEQTNQKQTVEEKQEKCIKECKNCECQGIKEKEKVEEKKSKSQPQNEICKKCKKNKSSLLHKNDPICKACLLMNIQYKCRLTLQNTMKVQEKSSILVCFSGGLNSICLVNLMSSLKKRYQKHHLFGELKCLHIQQQNNIPQNYKKIFEEQTGLCLQIINIGQVFEGQNMKSVDDVKQIFKMFNKAGNTADLLTLMRDRLIVNYAKKNNFNFVLKGLNGESIASSIFKYFAKGIGGEVTQLSSREPDSLFHFPLRQHLQKELQYYFYTLKLNKISLKSQVDDLSNFCSHDLDDRLSDFILNLQTMYSHTAPAITRTSEKIESNRKSENRCKWCLLKNAFAPNNLCRKCDRILENKNKLYDENKLPQWFKIKQNVV